MTAEVFQFKAAAPAYKARTYEEAHEIMSGHALYATAATNPLAARMLELSIEHLMDPDAIGEEAAEVSDLAQARQARTAQTVRGEV